VNIVAAISVSLHVLRQLKICKELLFLPNITIICEISNLSRQLKMAPRGGGQSRGGGRSRDSAKDQNRQPRGQPEATPEQLQAKATYHAWKRNIKNSPQANDTETISALWTGALAILNDDDRDWKQQLPRDLDSDEYYGREHIGTLMSMKSDENGSRTFVDLLREHFSTKFQMSKALRVHFVLWSHMPRIVW
jgi:hypothetical protein